MRLKMRKFLNGTSQSTYEKQFQPMIKETDSLKQSLAKHYYQAFHGTVDDEGKSLIDWDEEIQSVFEERYGKVMTEHSFYLEQESEIIASIFLTKFRGIPLIAYLAVDKNFRGNSLGELLIQYSCHSLASSDYQEIYLAVNEENLVAYSLYKKMGFTVIGTDWDEILKDR